MNTGELAVYIHNQKPSIPQRIIVFHSRVGIEHTTGESVNAYLAATAVTKPIQEEQPMATTPIAPSDSDSDSN